MKNLLVSIVLLLGAIIANAQGNTRYGDNVYIDLAGSASSKRFAGALSATHFSTPLKRIPRLQIGYGLRFTTFVAANQYYTTAPAKFTSPVQSLGTIFSRTIEENIDTISTATAVTYSLNAVLHIQYRIHRRVSAGFNIDLAGVSFGPEKQFNVISSVYDRGQSPVVTASPTRWNLLLTSDNDLGSLNSEFYALVQVNERIGIRGGYAFVFSEYRTTEDLSFDQGRIMNDRYRHKAGMVMLSISYRPFARS